MSEFADTVEEFIRSNGIDERAADTCRSTPQHVMEIVVARGALSGARNPSSAVLARIKEAKTRRSPARDSRGPPARDSRGPPARDSRGPSRGSWDAGYEHGDRAGWDAPMHQWLPPMPPFVGSAFPPGIPGPFAPGLCGMPFGLVDDIEHFIRTNIRDDRDRQAIDLLAGVVEAKRRSLGPPHGGPPHGGPPFGGPPHGYPVDFYGGGPPRDGRPNFEEYGRGPPPRRRSRSPSRRRSRPRSPPPGDIADRIDDFLRENPVDDKAAGALRQCRPEVAQMAMDKSITSARNPSSLLYARIRDAESINKGQDRSGGGDDRRDGHRSRSRGRGPPGNPR